MAYQNILVERKDRVAVITLNRPEALNALSLPLVEELLDSLTAISTDTAGVGAVVLTGAGRAFCAGGDVRAMKEAPDPEVFLKKVALVLHNCVSTLRRLPQPVIGAINGVATGAGFPLALACDILLAAEEARFNLPYVNIGLSPDGSSTYFLPRLLGPHRTLALAFTAEFLDARKGQELGFVHQVVKGPELMEKALALATKLASGPSVALTLAKELVNRSLGDTLEVQMEYERLALARCSRTRDFKEGLEAFFSKRPPAFKGNQTMPGKKGG